ncbi:MAG: hypothetical protein QM740_18115 [Acidovorax sp.]
MTSSAEHGSPEEDFLVDFLYADRPRLAVFAAQLFNDGHLTGLKRSSQTGVDSLLKIKGGVPGVAGGESSSTDKIQESVERQFDATWAAPLNVLRELNARGLIIDGVDRAALGQIVLVRGTIQVTDVRMLQKLWRPVVKAQEAKNLAEAKTESERKKIHRMSRDETSAVDLIELLPHALQFHIRNDEVACWATLDPDQMTINPADLAFKHGPSIPGEWLTLGVLDGKPSSPQEGFLEAVKHVNSPIQLGMVQVLKGLREAFGRGEDDYGITPLVIYRAVN